MPLQSLTYWWQKKAREITREIIEELQKTQVMKTDTFLRDISNHRYLQLKLLITITLRWISNDTYICRLLHTK